MTGELSHDTFRGAAWRTERTQVPHLNNWIRGAQLLKRWRIAESNTKHAEFVNQRQGGNRATYAYAKS